MAAPVQEEGAHGRRGLFLAVEGLDRSGKTTLVASLSELLRKEGHRVTALKFPDRSTPTGQRINLYLTGELELERTELEALFVENKKEKQELILRLFEQGEIIICDRYIASAVAYGTANGSPPAFIRELHQGLFAPQYTLFMEADGKLVSSRPGFGGERYEKVSFLDGVFRNFKEELGEHYISLPASSSLEEVLETAARIIRGILELPDNGPLHRYGSNPLPPSS
jgi:dTMP kinase